MVAAKQEGEFMEQFGMFLKSAAGIFLLAGLAGTALLGVLYALVDLLVKFGVFAEPQEVRAPAGRKRRHVRRPAPGQTPVHRVPSVSPVRVSALQEFQWTMPRQPQAAAGPVAVQLPPRRRSARPVPPRAARRQAGAVH